MKAKITSVEFKKEYSTRFGMLNLFKIGYDGKYGFYSSKSKEQKKFVIGEEAEFSEEIRKGEHGDYTNIKPIYNQNFSNYGKALKKEQSRYSGFAMAYAKDLVVADKIDIKEMSEWTSIMFGLMVELDKTLEA